VTRKKDERRLSQSLNAICSSNALRTGGLGVRFEVVNEDGTWPAFVVRHSNGLGAYINRCAHLALELDWDPGLFFDIDQRHLICATHGALYAANTGKCISGPCNGSGLEWLRVIETKGIVYLMDPCYVRASGKPKSER
jgi:nitrite reductase/ring-hydroxylating ferredoxin subunit